MNNYFRVFQIVLSVLLSIATGLVWFNAYKNTESVQAIEEQEQQEKKIESSFNLTFDNAQYSFNNEGITEVTVWTENISESVEGARMVLKYNPALIEILDVKKGLVFDVYKDESNDLVNGKIFLSGVSADGLKGYSKQVFAQINIKKIAEADENEYTLEILDESSATLTSQPLVSIGGDKLIIDETN